jgi:trehalose 6-phosphate synthase
LLVNPFDADSMADAMHQALIMPFEERHARWQAMMQQLKADGAAWWAGRFLAILDTAHRQSRPLSPTGT